MKNWLIKKLGGFTPESVLDIKKFHANEKKQLVQHIRKLEVEILYEQKDKENAQTELEALKKWRNSAIETLRRNKVPRHIVNKIMAENPKD